MAEQEPITWKTEQRRIGDLVEWDKNPRRLTEAQERQLAESLQKFGYVEEIVVNADGVSIIGGHMRRKVALARKYLSSDTMVDVRVPSRQLSESEAEELAIRLNRNTGEWDWDKIASEFDSEELVRWGFEGKELGIGPDFSPVTAEEQSRLDQKAQVTCPSCGTEFVPK